MRIGIDGHVLGKNVGGVERYVEKVVELVPNLCPRHVFFVFVSRLTEAHFAGDRRQNVKFITLPFSDPILQRSFVLPWLIRKHHLEILHVQRITPWFSSRCQILLTVHDLIPVKYPDKYPGFRNRLVRLLTPGSIARANFIVCPTQFVCDEIARYYPAARARRRPFYNGVDREKFGCRGPRPERQTLQRHAIDRPFVFSPGAIEDRKNIETIIEAIARIDRASRPLLILSGSIRDRACFSHLQNVARDLKVTDWVRHIGFVSDEDLIDLYGLAIACIAASRDEGFNFLPLEALACGAAVVCSDIPVHRELYDSAVFFFPPDRPDLLADTLRGFLEFGVNPAASAMATEAVLNRFSWNAMARRMAMYIEEMAHVGHLSARYCG